jgi:FMN phosphatase YigB (HAD superfamily)
MSALWWYIVGRQGESLTGIIPRGFEYRFATVPKLILFDLDDTLCDHAHSLTIRLRHAFEPLFVDSALREQVVRRSSELAWEGTQHFGDLFAEFGLNDGSAALLATKRYISDRYRGLELFDDALPVVSCVRQVATVGIITNGPTDIQQPKIDLLQIEHHVSFVLISERVGFWKPDVRIFKMALELGGAQPDEAMYIGDSPVADVPGAHNAGMHAVWMNRRGDAWSGGRPPHVEVRSLYELLSALGLSDENEVVG